jgi:hypothetical protein
VRKRHDTLSVLARARGCFHDATRRLELTFDDAGAFLALGTQAEAEPRFHPVPVAWNWAHEIHRWVEQQFDRQETAPPSPSATPPR